MLRLPFLKRFMFGAVVDLELFLEFADGGSLAPPWAHDSGKVHDVLGGVLERAFSASYWMRLTQSGCPGLPRARPLVLKRGDPLN